MKKFLVVVLALVMALAFAGCCKRIDSVTMVTTTTFGNCLTAAQELFCSPTNQEQAEASAVVDFLSSGISVAGLVFDVPITQERVRTIFSTILIPGACVLFTDLQLAVKWYESLTAALQTKVITRKMKGASKMPPAIPALQAAAKK